MHRVLDYHRQKLQAFSHILYLDTDTIIMNSTVNLIDELSHISSEGDIFISSDIIPYQDRFQTGVLLLRQSAPVRYMFNYLNTKIHHHRMTSFQENNKNSLESDQNLLNNYLNCKLSNHATNSSFFRICKFNNVMPIKVVNISRVMWNSFPSLPSPWQQMGLPKGDENTQLSRIVHFAGVYGGISIENGRPNYLATLLAVKGFIDRHIQFLLSISQSNLYPLQSFDILDIRIAIPLMKKVSTFMRQCIQDSFSGFIVEVFRHYYQSNRIDEMISNGFVISELGSRKKSSRLLGCGKRKSFTLTHKFD